MVVTLEGHKMKEKVAREYKEHRWVAKEFVIRSLRFEVIERLVWHIWHY